MAMSFLLFVLFSFFCLFVGTNKTSNRSNICCKLNQRAPILYHKLLSQKVHMCIQNRKEYILHQFFPPSYKTKQEGAHKYPEETNTVSQNIILLVNYLNLCLSNKDYWRSLTTKIHARLFSNPYLSYTGKSFIKKNS